MYAHMSKSNRVNLAPNTNGLAILAKALASLGRSCIKVAAWHSWARSSGVPDISSGIGYLASKYNIIVGALVNRFSRVISPRVVLLVSVKGILLSFKMAFIISYLVHPLPFNSYIVFLESI